MAAVRILLVAVITFGQILMRTEAFILADFQHLAVDQPLEETDRGDVLVPGIEDVRAFVKGAEDMQSTDIGDVKIADSIAEVVSAIKVEDVQAFVKVNQGNEDDHSTDIGARIGDIKTTDRASGIGGVTPLLDESGVNENLVIDIPTNKTKRDIECGLSPIGVSKPCLVCDGSRFVFFTDINGHTCQCEVCRLPKYMEEPCICTATGEVASESRCSFPTYGEEYMDESNFCDRPKKCSQCPGNLVVTVACTLYTDTVCGCPKDTYRTDNTQCDPIPPCQKNFEIHEIAEADSLFTTYECRPCGDGFMQPNDNSLDRCRPIIEQEDTTDFPQDENTVQEQHTVPLTPRDEPNEPPSAIPEPTPEVNCPPSCCTSEPPDTRQTTASESKENISTGCNVTYDDNVPEKCNSMVLSFAKHPVWLGITIGSITITVLLLVFSALVYGSKNPERVKCWVERLRLQKLFYTSTDLPLYTQNSESPSTVEHCPNANDDEMQRLTTSGTSQDMDNRVFDEQDAEGTDPQLVETPGTQNSESPSTAECCPNTNSDEIQSLTTSVNSQDADKKVFNEQDAKGGKRGKSQKKYARERSKNDSVKT